jgi:hypothetical protein
MALLVAALVWFSPTNVCIREHIQGGMVPENARTFCTNTMVYVG